MSIITSPLLLGADGVTQYQISRSLRFNGPDSSFLSRQPSSAGNRKTWTWAGWVKRSGLDSNSFLFAAGPRSSSGNPAGLTILNFINNTLEFSLYTPAASVVQLVTTQVFRDPSAWYHIVAVLDTDNATSTERLRLYVNGSRITAFNTATYPAQGVEFSINNTQAHEIGRYVWSEGNYLNAYLADIHFIDGQALDPSSFTETNATTGQLIPKAYTGSYGTSRFKLDFSSNATTAALGTDTSGNGNTWTTNNFSVTAGANNDSLVDTPTSYGTDTGVGAEVRGNYATLNALDTANTLSNGNLQLNNPSTGFKGTRGTVGMSSGKWYFETTFTAIASPTNTAPALYKPNSTLNTGGGSYGNNYISIVEYPANTLNITLDGWSSTAYSQAGSLPVGTIVGIAFDADSGKIWFSTNGTWLNSGNPAAGTGAVYSSIPAGTYFFGGYAYSTSDQLDFNFGQRAFAYTAPSGFKALVDTNLPAPTIALSNTAFDTKLYTGNGGTQTISGLGFSPDFVWLKGRSVAYSHQLYDQVRGAGKLLNSNLTNAESTVTDNLTAFTSTGFTLGNDAGTNQSSATYVGWAWDAGTTTVSNSVGSITASLRANASSGFSIVGYTGTGSSGTLGHGLNVKPQLIIVKSRTQARDWLVYHASYGATQYMTLNGTGAAAATTSAWNNTEPTSTVFTIGNAAEINTNGSTNIAYCFAPVSGYSSFGSYTGNGSTDGPLVYTGFRPRWLLTKSSSYADEWRIYDAVRLGYNAVATVLTPGDSQAEGATGYPIDLLSNGFKLRGAGGPINESGQTYIYACFAESPLQYSRAR
jgi:hypothetical protein